jgi:hypothetical protein
MNPYAPAMSKTDIGIKFLLLLKFYTCTITKPNFSDIDILILQGNNTAVKITYITTKRVYYAKTCSIVSN